MFHAQFDRLRTFLSALQTAGEGELKDRFINEVIETGGTYTKPADDGWASHMFEVSLHGVSAYGSDEDEAIRNWMIAAHRQSDGYAPP